jgi:hypothetical protein
MPTSERSLTVEELAIFNNYGAIGMQLIGHVPSNRPEVLAAGVDAYIQRRKRPLKHLLTFMKDPERDNAVAARALGTVWANQVVREFGWEWICMTLDDKEHIVPAAPDRSLVLFAPEYVEECLVSKDTQCKVAVSMDMLRTGALPVQGTLSYSRMMKVVRRAQPHAADRATALLKKAKPAKATYSWNDACVECICI